MRDLVIRLASMKLAELKFDVLVRTKTPPVRRHQLSLREIKDFLKEFHEDENARVLAKGYFSWGNTPGSGLFYQVSIEYLSVSLKWVEYMDVKITKPADMSIEIFKKLMESLL